MMLSVERLKEEGEFVMYALMTASGTPDATNFITSFADAESLEIGCAAVVCEGTGGVVGPAAAVEFVAV